MSIDTAAAGFMSGERDENAGFVPTAAPMAGIV